MSSFCDVEEMTRALRSFGRGLGLRIERSLFKLAIEPGQISPEKVKFANPSSVFTGSNSWSESIRYRYFKVFLNLPPSSSSTGWSVHEFRTSHNQAPRLTGYRSHQIKGNCPFSSFWRSNRMVRASGIIRIINISLPVRCRSARSLDTALGKLNVEGRGFGSHLSCQ